MMIMKKLFYLLLTISLVSSVSFVLTSCGGDDDGTSSVIDGVNVYNGKKLTRLEVPKNSFRVFYDSKGRLTNVVWTHKIRIYENGKYSEAEVNIMRIDYDFRIVSISNAYSSANYMFSLNDKGYISQIGNCSCSYDSYGYLTRVENVKEIWSLVYNEGELIKSLVNSLKYGDMEIYYMFYGESKDSGELIFYMNSEKENGIGDKPEQAVMCFIAYQSGLFGKITNHCTYLSRSNETSAVLERNNEKNSNKFVVHCNFTFE